MILPIFTYGEKILRDKANEVVDFNDPTLPAFIADMFETMLNANGVGLAAPQVGVDKCIIIVEEELTEGEIFKGVFINPKIISVFGRKVLMKEGCLSFPGICENIVRNESIDIEWSDEKGEKHRDFFHGVPSRILQHEIDHVNGALMSDLFDSGDRLMNFMKFEAIKNKKVKPPYPIV